MTNDSNPYHRSDDGIATSSPQTRCVAIPSLSPPRPTPQRRGGILHHRHANPSAWDAGRATEGLEPPTGWSLFCESIFRAPSAGFVAQICNLPYRRLAVGRPSDSSRASAVPDDRQSATLRYSRVQLCATLGARRLLSQWERLRGIRLLYRAWIRTVPATVDYYETSIRRFGVSSGS